MSQASWRAAFLFCFAFGIFIFVLCFVFLCETYRDDKKFDTQLPSTKTQQQQQQQQQHQNGDDCTITLDDPPSEKDTSTTNGPKKLNLLTPFLMLRHPFVFFASFVSGVAFGSMFAVETILPDIFESNYGFNSWQTGKNATMLVQSVH